MAPCRRPSPTCTRAETPLLCIAVAAAIPCLHAWWLGGDSEGIIHLVLAAVCAWGTAYLLVTLSVVLLRIRRPDLPRAYRSPLFPLPQLFSSAGILLGMFYITPPGMNPADIYLPFALMLGLAAAYALFWTLCVQRVNPFRPLAVEEVLEKEFAEEDQQQREKACPPGRAGMSATGATGGQPPIAQSHPGPGAAQPGCVRRRGAGRQAVAAYERAEPRGSRAGPGTPVHAYRQHRVQPVRGGAGGPPASLSCVTPVACGVAASFARCAAGGLEPLREEPCRGRPGLAGAAHAAGLPELAPLPRRQGLDREPGTPGACEGGQPLPAYRRYIPLVAEQRLALLGAFANCSACFLPPERPLPALPDAYPPVHCASLWVYR